VWQDNQGRASNDIFYKGNTIAFYPFVDVTRTNAGTSANPAVATSGNNMYIVWEDDTSGNFEILYRRSTDGGANFGENGVAINLSNNAGTSTIPFVAASGNNVYIVWEDDTSGNFEILYRRSTDGGANFGATINLSNNAGVSANPAIALSGNNVYVIWQDDTPGDGDILYRRSTDGGASFDATINLSNNAGTSTIPFVAASGNNVYIVWEDDTSGNFEILYRKSTDGGASFDATVNLSNNAGFSAAPAIAVSGDNLYVVWHDNNDTPVNEILYRRSSDGGASFNAVINLSNNAGSSNNPDVAAINNLPV
jgi:hypothetical protein